MKQKNNIVPQWMPCSPVACYGIALTAVAVAALIRHMLAWALATVPYLIFSPAVVVAAALGGVGPGMVATFVSLLFVHFVFGTFNAYDSSAMIKLVIWTTSSAGVSLLAGGQREARVCALLRARELQESEARLRLSIKSAGIGLWDWDLESNEIFYSPEWKSQIGFRNDEIPNRFEEWQNRVHPDDLETTFKKVQIYLANPQGPNITEFRLQHKDGSYRWIYAHSDVLYNDTGKPMRMLGCHIDITERKQVENQVRESENDLRMLAESMPQIVWITRPDGWNVYFNQQWVDYTGMTLEESYGHGWNRPFHPDDRLRAWNAWQQATATGDTYSLECRLRRVDGVYRWWLIRGVPVHDVEGTILKWFGTCTDIEDIKRTEELLVMSKKVLQDFTDNSPALIYAVDTEGRFLLTNRRFDDVLDVPSTTMIGKTRESFMPPEIAAKHRANDLQVIMDRQPITFEEENEERDGRHTYLSIKFPLFDLQGDVSGICGISTDITERKQAEIALQESNSLLRVAGRMALFGGWSVNLVDGKQTWSDEVARIHDEPPGYSPEVTDGINYYAPEWREKISAVFNSCVRDGTPYDEEMQIITARGRLVWVRTIGEAVRDAVGEIIRVHGAFQDITERKLAEAALQKSEEQFRVIANSMPNLAWWASSDGYITWYNQRWFEYTGTSPEQMEGWGWQSVHDPEMLPQVMERWTASIATGELFDMEFQLRRADGVFRTFLTRVLPMKDSDGKVLRWFGTNTDISDMKQAQVAILKTNEELEERVRERTAQLEAVNKELETFTYSVSHDLKAPLRGIDGYSQLLEMEYSDRLDEEGQLFIHNVRTCVAQMNELIDDLLSYSRMERRFLQNSLIDLPALVQVVLAERMADIEQGKVQINLLMPSIFVRTDRDGLAVVLRNLLENSIKFSRNAQPPMVEVGARVEEGRTIIWVRDNGVGFDMKFHDRIFEIFQRLQRAEEYPGTGIGLALVHKSMQRMGGRVWAESAPGQGATFYLEVPNDNRIV